MTTVRRAYVDGPFGQMHVRVAGEQGGHPPLICFHMSPMSGRIYQRFLAALAEQGRMAIAIDTPGFGMSDAPPSPPGIADYSRAMQAAIDALGLAGPVDLMGYHTGSMIAADLAADRPDLVRRLVCVSAPIFTAEELAELRLLYAPHMPTADGAHLLKRWQGFVHWNLGRGLTIEDLNDMFPEGLLAGNREWWGHNAAFSYMPDMRLTEVTQPVLVLSTNDDLQEQSRRAPALMRHGRVVELPGWGHGFLDGFPADAADLVRSFLDAPDGDPFGAIRIPQSARQ
ncbi:alpha/beta fold hydrolase [Sphingomonas sp. LaA6.9]|uniref:alpha/beta fold hydrolase n=1 Tax=Sphingomonas sp. LaA6.9 TaxID=2919914 RepID=UPI001F4F9D47|nr:alpha/beta fold hydrolase [Sphingomonas sp. LaA6.9]MCJ8157370.1 alpha/beta hydrolase [Sphingomonas sp. LaA6.9]